MWSKLLSGELPDSLLLSEEELLFICSWPTRWMHVALFVYLFVYLFVFSNDLMVSATKCLTEQYLYIKDGHRQARTITARSRSRRLGQSENEGRRWPSGTPNKMGAKKKKFKLVSDVKWHGGSWSTFIKNSTSPTSLQSKLFWTNLLWLMTSFLCRVSSLSAHNKCWNYLGLFVHYLMFVLIKKTDGAILICCTKLWKINLMVGFINLLSFTYVFRFFTIKVSLIYSIYSI